MKFHFKLHSQSDAQGDSLALLTAALMHKNALIIPLLRVVRAPYFKLRFMPTRSGGIEQSLKFHFKLHSQSDAQGDSLALLTAALMHKNALIIPLLRVVRAPILNYVLCRREAAEWSIL